ncbi:MAG TPA: DNA polymerase III subunit alpha, partial [Methylomirabilota bacterium]
RDALKRLKPQRIEDIIAMVALYRPGPMDLIEDFVNRKHGRAPIAYEHPLMERHLQETYGIMVYQEQVMRLAADLAGFSLGEADTLRKAMGKKDRELMAQQREKFVSGCKANKIDVRKAERIWDLIEKFAGYGFNKSHAACYGVVAYQTAYLKANYPTEFMAALLTSEMDKTDKIVQYVEETRAMGLRVEPPDVNVSRAQFTVSGDAIHFGLAAIKNVGATAIESIVKVREADGGFTSLDDFCARVDLRLVNRRVVECLIKAGAFDSLQSTRAGLLASLDQAMDGGQRRQRDREEGQVSLFDAPGGGPAPTAPAPPPAARVPEWPPEEMLAFEREVLGFYLSGHPLEQYREVSRRIGALGAADLAARSTGARVLLLGQVSAFTENATKSGNRMAFATLELVDGSVPLTIFPEPYRSCAGALRHKGPVIVKGRADDSDKGRVVLAEEIKPLEDAVANGSPPGNGHGNGNGYSNGHGNGHDNGHGDAHACRIRVSATAEALPVLLAGIKTACREHEGRTPLFLHVLLPEQEVVVRVKELGVNPEPDLVSKVEGLLGPGSILVEYAGRA